MSTKFLKVCISDSFQVPLRHREKQLTNCFYFVVLNLVLIPQFSSHLNENRYTSNVTDEPQ